MGVDSGLPDFRGNEGFWRAYPAAAKLGLSFQELANPDWFRSDPRLAWAFYGHRMNLYRHTVPHAGFGQLLEWGQAKRNGYFVYTSNVDGHFQKSGFDPNRVFECHGSIHHFQCAMPCRTAIWVAADETVTVDETEFRAAEPLPECQFCGCLARPNVLMFGDVEWIPSRSRAQELRFGTWLGDLRAAAARLAIIEFGAGTGVPSVRMASEHTARAMGAKLVRINPRESQVPTGQIGLPMGALDAVRQLAEVMVGK